jgi:hypothetical protein
MIFQHRDVVVVGRVGAGSGSVSSSLASNSFALMMMKQTFSGEMVSGDASSVPSSFRGGFAMLRLLNRHWSTSSARRRSRNPAAEASHFSKSLSNALAGLPVPIPSGWNALYAARGERLAFSHGNRSGRCATASIENNF